ncbi:MAG: deoxynucleoside kinase [Ignavibacteriae bacterium]|nr:deoxynucleoside kinase [Ignavibacteria bacterium]MBI3363795.1 deoxynucleoside kinase [Ignavibacteriota bacterium]
MKSKLFVAVAGNIGSGKSSLTKLLSEHYGWKSFYESVDDNPYLADFYADMNRWSFNLQVYFLSKRFNDHKKIVDGSESVIQDRSIYEDAEIFARNLFLIGKMDKRDYENYVELYHVMIHYLRPPDLLIYLDARIETLLKQISRRGREYEQSIPRTYLEQLSMHYREWIGSYKEGPLLVIPSDEVDFVHERGDFNRMLLLIQGKLMEIGYLQTEKGNTPTNVPA